MERTTRKRTASSYRSYQRSNTYRKKPKSAAPERFNLKELLIMQCIVCGVMLLFVMIISFVDLPITKDLRLNLKTALTTDVSQEALDHSTASATETISGVQSKLKSFFGFEDRDVNNGLYQNTLDGQNTWENEMMEEETMEVFSGGEGAFRIDEDILRDIKDSENFSADTEKKY